MLNTCLLVRVQFLQSLLASITSWTIYLEAHHHLLPLRMPIKNIFHTKVKTKRRPLIPLLALADTSWVALLVLKRSRQIFRTV
ncbi:hypothetical protein BD769DRAFT_1457242 [Suillus cothurnatus]|nr:hypothetical protein BD769DRAFT_1457242 [Suillus cothurnatus]